MQLILPKTLVPDDQVFRPLIFLAGPIKGGANWQETACQHFIRKEAKIAVVAPRCWLQRHPNHSLGAYKASGNEDTFARQTLWERHYLERAACWGCILFWLPCESASDPRDDGQPYARDTYGELGAWRTRKALDASVRLIIGAEPDFPGLSVLRCNLDEDVGYKFPIYSSLEETLEAALRLAATS